MEIQNDSDQQQMFYCFSPNCSITCRVYYDYKSVSKAHQKCSGWIISSSLLFNSSKSKYGTYNQQTIQDQGNDLIINNLDYISEPIKSLLVMEKIFQIKEKTIDEVLQGNNQQMNPLKILEFNFSLLRDKIERALNFAYQKIQTRIKTIQKRNIQTLKVIRNIAGLKNVEQISKEIANSIELMEFNNFTTKIGNLTLVNSYQAFDQIQKTVECVQKLSESFWREQPQSLKKQRFGMNKAFQKIRQFAQDSSVPFNQKIQALASMWGTAVPPINVDNQKQVAKNQCWICHQQLQGYGNNIKQRKNDALKSIFSHVLTVHQNQIALKYFDKQLKFNAFRIDFSEFIHQIQSFPYKKFILVDSQNSPKSDHHLKYAAQSDVYVIHVISHLRQSIAKGKYILADSKGKDSADILIILLVTMICKSKGFFKRLNSNIKEKIFEQDDHTLQKKDCQIILVTRDHFGVTLQQNFRGIGVQIIIDKK